jgi:hypothetical protein
MRMLAPLLCGFGIYTWKGITLSLTLAPKFVWMRPRLRERVHCRWARCVIRPVLVRHGTKDFLFFSQFIKIKMWRVRERRAAKGTTKE